MATIEAIAAANARGEGMRKSHSGIAEARYRPWRREIILRLESGLSVIVPRDKIPGLEGARVEQLTQMEISPSRLGLHFPALDVDLYLPALLEGVLGPQGWSAEQIGREGGRARSEAKAKAARENGRKGGRPRTSA